MLATAIRPTYPGQHQGRGDEPTATLPIPPRTASHHHTPRKITSGMVGASGNRLKWRDRLHGPCGPVYVYKLNPDGTKGELLRIEAARTPGAKRPKKKEDAFTRMVRQSREAIAAQHRETAGIIVMGEMD